MDPPDDDQRDRLISVDEEQKSAERRIDDLIEAVAARDNFIAIAAHELRNPMTPVIGQIELILEGLRTQKYTLADVLRRLERVERSMQHYLKRAVTLLEVSRISSGKLRLTLEFCDLSQIITHVVDSFAEAAVHAGASINIDVPDHLMGNWDQMALEQIVDNLVSNALKYGGNSPVAVSAVHTPDGVSIRVADQGPGISAADRARIFGRFERAITPARQQPGFGVGLWLVGELVEAMSGTITVENADGQGSVFVVNLPQTVMKDDGHAQ